MALLLMIVFVWFVASCSSLSKAGADIEGKIVYEISYPYEPQSVMMDLYPKEMTVTFKENKLHSSIKSEYDMLTTDFIVDNTQKEFAQLLKNMSERSAMKMNKEQTMHWFDEMPGYRLEKTTETKIICGYKCYKTIAHPEDPAKPTIDIYATRSIGLDNSNWWNPYRDLEGFMMAYDIEQYGICMRMKAKRVCFERVEPTEFDIPQTYTMTDAPTMQGLLTEVVETYVKK
ncbi:MAG: hypothetical protein ACK5BL_04705 [Flavobacteriales bacterium]